MDTLLRILNALSLTSLAERMSALADQEDAELGVIESELLALFDAVRAGGHSEHLTTAEARVEFAQALAAATTDVQALAAERIDAATALQSELDAIELARPEPAAEVEPVVEPAAEVEPVVEPAPEPVVAEAPAPAPEPEPVVEPERVPALVASAAPAAPARPNLSALARAATPPPAAAASEPEWRGPGGVAVTTLAQADGLMIAAHAATATTPGVVARIPVLSRVRPMENFRTLREGDPGGNADKMQALIASVQHADMEGLIASGFCAPAQPDYRQDTLGVVDRPVRDGLPQVGLDRGRITVGAAPVLSDVLVDQAAAAITNITSAEITEGGTKTVQCFVACPDEVTTALEETAVRLCFSDWQQFSWAERNAAITRLSMVSAARQKDLRLLGLIDAGSVWVSQLAVLGTLRDVLAIADQIVAMETTRLRDPDVRFHALFPSTLWTRMRTDMLRAMNSEIGMIDVAEQLLRSAFDSRRINVTIELDSEVYAAQPGAVGGPAVQLDGFAITLTWRIFPEGTWTVGTGPEQQLGVVRDSTRVGQNRFETFDASWETAFRYGGWPSYRVAQNVCENGTSSGTVDLSELCPTS